MYIYIHVTRTYGPNSENPDLKPSYPVQATRQKWAIAFHGSPKN